ncbi:hypothetical protein BCU70_05080 [Vibrio sp. 10N.286.49.C2]|uniref:glycerophosphodiester phosphodiesterase family protein n=1 Tax=unclassified Vibrio TaxID=2614977 RepID=UPI000C844D63|nr:MULTISPECIES: glycerophosphodiester phosphodiesterase family protein [unclassified Vibrio]PMH33855.1 hypothetical protein BCU70_05080 [Vibrio sp. 10N.286.49.C2]PMH44113.1 hypothetical protein BCU66_03990 [Vibrio sp. 10N.286.49.B1]PMH80938.1 hypothetical protein BCU58_22475 [Vibrio sp. 10N.286.48.B7]
MSNNKLWVTSFVALTLVGCSDDKDDNTVVESNVIVYENFEGIEEGSLPEGWDIITNIGDAYIEDGSLYIDGRADNYTATAIELPQVVASHANYKVEVNFTIAEANNSSRWGGIKYRIAGDQPYYQMAIRQGATSGNGTELSSRYNDEWDVMDTMAFDQDIDSEQIYTATITTFGNRVQQTLNGQVLHDADILPMLGNVGLQAAGAVLKVQDIKITEQHEPLPKLEQIYTVNEPETNIAMAPSIVTTNVQALDDLQSLPVSNAWLQLDANLDLTSLHGMSLGSLAELLEMDLNTIPVIRMSNDVDPLKLSELLNKTKSLDVTVVSDNVDALQVLRQASPNVRSAFEFLPQSDDQSISNWHDVVSDTTRSKSRIVVVPQNWATKENMRYLQRRLLTVWVVADETESTADLMTLGAHGLVVDDTDTINQALTAFPENSLIRKPLFIGHRGVPSLLPENTLESAVKALELGVDGNEYDVYLSADNHVVVIHDATVDRTTDGTGLIEEMSLAEIKQLNILNIDGSVSDMKVPTLDEFFETFKGEEMTHFLEIKSGNPLIVDEISRVTERYDVADQLIVIAFSEEQAKRMGDVMPEIPVGLLTGHSEGRDENATLLSMLKKVQPISTTYNPSYAALANSTVEAAKHRGVTVWPWTYRNEQDQQRDYAAGIHGLTTDYIQWSSDFVTDIEVETHDLTVDVDAVVAVDATIKTQIGELITWDANHFVVIESSADYQLDDSGKLIFTTSGEAQILARYFHEFDAVEESNEDQHNVDGYHIFSAPITVTIN